MTNNRSVKSEITRGAIYTVVLTIVFILFTADATPLPSLLIALPYFTLLYFLMFTIDRPAVTQRLRDETYGHSQYTMAFPLFMVVLFYSYLVANGQNPFKGSLLLLPYLLLFPVVAFAYKGRGRFGGFDFLVFFLFFFPVTLVKIDPQGALPYGGGGFDSVYRIVIMLTAIFSFGIIRGLRDMGAYPRFSWQHLFTTIWVWLVFYSFVMTISYPIGFIRFSESSAWDLQRVESILRKMVSIFLHTALFEELVFRGILQNMIGKRIAQSDIWRRAWWQGAIVLTALSLFTGYAMKGGMNWFPALITIVLFMGAWLLEKAKKQPMGSYTALAITSVLFGLVHFHSGSLIFTGLASIGGWAYGYVYLRTKNTFYAALLHTLVNASPLIFGLTLAK